MERSEIEESKSAEIIANGQPSGDQGGIHGDLGGVEDVKDFEKKYLVHNLSRNFGGSASTRYLIFSDRRVSTLGTVSLFPVAVVGGSHVGFLDLLTNFTRQRFLDYRISR